MTLVVDASVALWACDDRRRFGRLRDRELVAPRLLWSECAAVIHAAQWRRKIPAAQARWKLDRLLTAPIEPRERRDLLPAAWRLADELGWAKTYDAEYLALAQLLDCRLVTLDLRLRRGADRLGLVVRLDEL